MKTLPRAVYLVIGMSAPVDASALFYRGSLVSTVETLTVAQVFRLVQIIYDTLSTDTTLCRSWVHIPLELGKPLLRLAWFLLPDLPALRQFKELNALFKMLAILGEMTI